MRYCLPTCDYAFEHIEVANKRPQRMLKGCRLILLKPKVTYPSEGIAYHTNYIMQCNEPRHTWDETKRDICKTLIEKNIQQA